MSYRILVVNPGSTSTKIGVYEDENLLFDKTLRHSAEELEKFDSIPAQKDWRRKLVMKALEDQGFDVKTLSAVSGRGGLLAPIRGGTYAVSDRLVRDCTVGVQGQHASNLGGIIAREIGAMAVVMKGQVDQIILTGGIAYGKETVDAITDMVGWIAPITVYPGEDELLALAQGALRVLNGEEPARVY